MTVHGEQLMKLRNNRIKRLKCSSERPYFAKFAYFAT